MTPILMSYVNRYIKNLKPSDLQLSLWGGDVVLSKLELKLDVLEQVCCYNNFLFTSNTVLCFNLCSILHSSKAV